MKQPKGLYLLFFTELWERFSYYGMRGLLILYLTKSVIEGGLGFSDQNGGLIYGLYTGFVYLTPIIGGWLADNYIGQRRSIAIGAFIMTIGQFCLFFSSAEQISLFYLGLIFLIIGNGFFKPNITTLVGKLYAPDDKRRQNAFYIFYMGINIGAFFSPLICGTLAENTFATKAMDGSIERYAFQYGFLAAGIGMVIGQILYNMLGKKYLGDIGIVADGKKEKVIVNNKVEKEPLTKIEKDRLTVILIMVLFATFFWAGFEQAGSSMNLYADRYIDREVLGWTIPTSWLQSVNPVFIILLTPFFTMFWPLLNRKGKEPNDIVKMGFALILLGLGFCLMVGAGIQRGGDFVDSSIKANLLWLVGAYLLHTTGELCLSPIGLSLVTKLAPLRLASMMMGIWFLSSVIANFLSGYLVKYFAALGAMKIFGIIALFVICCGIVLLLLSKKIVYKMHGIK
ncbi:MAG: peptide MFS transporter [Candidatus Azobacteroides sp.]|nr:peptide MFS transporter [Candidatus Azobacteroides sp.]